MGLAVDVFNGEPENVQRLLDVYFREALSARIVVSIDAISLTPCLSVDLHNARLIGGTEAVLLTSEQACALRDYPEMLPSFLSKSGVAAINSLWIVAVNVVDDLAGMHSLPIAVMPAGKGAADVDVAIWFEGIMAYLCQYDSVLAFSSDGDRCLVKRFLLPISRKIWNQPLTDIPHRLRDLPADLFVRESSLVLLSFVSDPRHWLKNARQRLIKYVFAAIPHNDAVVISPSDFMRAGMSESTLSDRSCFQQDDLKAEEMFKFVYF